MRFQLVKCNIMHITRKWIKKTYDFNTVEGTVLDNVEKIKYLGITMITIDLKWNTHQQFCTKVLGVLRYNLAACPQYAKESALKGLMRPVLEYEW